MGRGHFSCMMSPLQDLQLVVHKRNTISTACAATIQRRPPHPAHTNGTCPFHCVVLVRGRRYSTPKPLCVLSRMDAKVAPRPGASNAGQAREVELAPLVSCHTTPEPGLARLNLTLAHPPKSSSVLTKTALSPLQSKRPESDDAAAKDRRMKRQMSRMSVSDKVDMKRKASAVESVTIGAGASTRNVSVSKYDLDLVRTYQTRESRAQLATNSTVFNMMLQVPVSSCICDTNNDFIFESIATSTFKRILQHSMACRKSNGDSSHDLHAGCFFTWSSLPSLPLVPYSISRTGEPSKYSCSFCMPSKTLYVSQVDIHNGGSNF